MLAGMGVLMAVSPTVAHLSGAGRRDEIGSVVRQALWIAAGLTALTVTLYFGAAPVLVALDLEAELHPTILGYVRALLWGAAPLYAFLVLRFFCEGLEVGRPVMYFGFVGLAVNVAANYALIYGRWGFRSWARSDAATPLRRSGAPSSWASRSTSGVTEPSESWGSLGATRCRTRPGSWPS